MKLDEVIKLAATTGARAALATLDELSGDALKASIDEITRRAVKAGADAVEKERAAQRRQQSAKQQDRRLWNTRLLLKHYRSLKAHFENAVYEFEEEQQAGPKPGEIWELMNARPGSEETYIESIRHSARRTMIIITHIERITGIYESYCITSNMPSMQRRWRVLHGRYLAENPKSLAAIAEEEHVARRTVERDLEEAIHDLTALLFGIDAVMMQEGR